MDKGFPDNMPAIWRLQWGHIPHESGTPVVIGEWGGRLEGADKPWQEKMAAFLADPANRIAGSFCAESGLEPCAPLRCVSLCAALTP